MMGLRGESMNPMTFGNMTHPIVCVRNCSFVCLYITFLFAIYSYSFENIKKIYKNGSFLRNGFHFGINLQYMSRLIKTLQERIKVFSMRNDNIAVASRVTKYKLVFPKLWVFNGTRVILFSKKKDK